VTALADQPARKRIATDLEANLRVEAAAGTGKTTVLVERVVNLLASGQVTVDELVVITFTEKAAAELSARVRDELEARALVASGDERGRLERAAADLYRAHIETIHSFATALLRERPVEAHIDPLFEVLEGVGASVDFDEAYERFQDELLSQNLPELDRALRRGFGLDELREAAQALNQHRYLLPLQLPAAPGDDSDRDEAVARIQAVANELRELMTSCQPGADTAVPIVEGILKWVEDLTALGPGEQERWLVGREPAKTHKGKGSNAAWRGEKQRLKDLQGEYNDAVQHAKDTLRGNALLGLLPHIAGFVERYAEERKKRGKADFDDLLFWARDLLRDSPAARDYFRRRFRAVLIDEFQDTDPVQAELALILTSDNSPNGDWRDLPLGAGRLTVVADPKQSIYRFRRADIALYDEVGTGPLKHGHELISTNFRSNPQLLRTLNYAFDRILQAEEGVQPGNVDLDSPPRAEVSKRAPVVVAAGEMEGKPTAGDIRAEEARVIAAMLHTAHQQRWEIRDRFDENHWRRCTWGDIAILVPARTGIERYEEALATAGIPYRHEGSRDFFQRDEVRDLIAVLSAVDDPTDRVALVGALRSSAFAVSDDQLVIHFASARSLSYRSPVTGVSEAVNHAFAELHDLYKLRRRLSLGELVRRVVERTRLVEFALTREDGEQGAANLMAIIDDARLFAAAGGGGLRPFIRHLRDAITHEAIEIEATVAEETDDVVRIMTIHGAKGLEFPIVALANLGTQHNPQAEPIPCEEEHFLEFRVGAKQRNGHFPTPGFEAAWEDEKEYIDAERRRLLYVAATRARDLLMVPCVVAKLEAKELLGELVRALPEDKKLVELLDAADLQAPEVEPPEAGPARKKEVDAALAIRERWIDARRTLRQQAGRERDIEVASSRERATGPLAAEVSTFASALLIGDGPPIPVGDAVHMVMERLSLPGAENLEQVVEDVCLEGAITEQLDDVLAMCRACLGARSVKEALAGGEWWREVPFVLSRTNDGSPFIGPLTAGRVDLVYRQGDELVVVDYKTDKGITQDNAEKLTLEHHGGQAEAYQQAIAAATALPVKEVVFVYCRAGIEVRVRDSEIIS
jgi:ATP-dependent exoDNAse (exonuclease V) beta subunit